MGWFESVGLRQSTAGRENTPGGGGWASTLGALSLLSRFSSRSKRPVPGGVTSVQPRPVSKPKRTLGRGGRLPGQRGCSALPPPGVGFGASPAAAGARRWDREPEPRALMSPRGRSPGARLGLELRPFGSGTARKSSTPPSPPSPASRTAWSPARVLSSPSPTVNPKGKAEKCAGRGPSTLPVSARRRSPAAPRDFVAPSGHQACASCLPDAPQLSLKPQTVSGELEFKTGPGPRNSVWMTWRQPPTTREVRDVRVMGPVAREAMCQHVGVGGASKLS
ncbi:uncharacterized protein LOC129558934 [Moschus berezovskii]|uniref:uncharacterized protein LOC129558934 n=1 Tax=Moschus berezovskii TaxID=68408 RepID=UPI002443F94B|nr:uncharacterized protein LOC129558934 [Moschus berezovskii]